MPWWSRRFAGEIWRLPDGEVIYDDALRFLASLKEGCANIVFLDPPFNLGKAYGSNPGSLDRVAEEAYFAFLRRIIERAVAILKPGGALFLYHVPRWAVRLAPLFHETLNFRHWIAVSMKNGFPRGAYLHPAHYALLYYTKGLPGSFARPKTPLAVCRGCGQTIRDYGGHRRFVAGGVNLTDFWDDVSPVRHKKYKHRIGNELPVKLLHRVVAISGCTGGLLVDPFVGAGTSLVAARAGGMRFVGCDRERESVLAALNRLSGERSPMVPQGNGR